MGKIPGVRRVSAKEVRELSKLPWVRDEALSQRMTEARVLPDGRVLLLIAPGIANVWPSREVLAEVCREAEAEVAKGPIDPTRKFLPPIDDFLRDVETLAASLAERIGVPVEALDRTPASLDAVDEALRRLPKKVKRKSPEIVTPLVAYVGEVMRAGCGGRWTKPRNDSNEPLIQGHDGRLLQPFALVVLPMFEPSRRIPLRAAVDVYLLPYRAGNAAGSTR
jgi:hypothetical protein